MPPKPTNKIDGHTAVVDRANVDTDQIIPARFLTTTERGALADACFHDWRFTDDGQPTDHPLNAIDRSRQTILVAGDNFGCGSSREHAAWALKDFGFQAVITSRAADIFKSNALKNGVVVVEVPADDLNYLLANQDMALTVDLDNMTVNWGNRSLAFQMDPFARTCLRQGLDPMGFLLAQADAIEEYEAKQAA